jgi:hypothetical protein
MNLLARSLRSLGVCDNVSCSTHSHIQAALSMGQRVFLDLPGFRNFYGHRNRLRYRAAQNPGPKYLLPSNLKPSEMLIRKNPAAGTSVLEDWLAELRITAEFLCEQRVYALAHRISFVARRSINGENQRPDPLGFQ